MRMRVQHLTYVFSCLLHHPTCTLTSLRPGAVQPGLTTPFVSDAAVREPMVDEPLAGHEPWTRHGRHRRGNRRRDKRPRADASQPVEHADELPLAQPPRQHLLGIVPASVQRAPLQRSRAPMLERCLADANTLAALSACETRFWHCSSWISRLLLLWATLNHFEAGDQSGDLPELLPSSCLGADRRRYTRPEIKYENLLFLIHKVSAFDFARHVFSGANLAHGASAYARARCGQVMT